MPASRYVDVESWSTKQGFREYVDLFLLCLTETDLRSPPLELKVLGDIKRLIDSTQPSRTQDHQHCNGAVTTVGGEHSYSNGKRKHYCGRLDPEYWKTALSALYAMLVCGVTSFVMVLVHERVPDMRTYPPLPDIFLD
ncbi:hypothetical protein M9458_033885, partial [Cirrhinus mrigala]